MMKQPSPFSVVSSKFNGRGGLGTRAAYGRPKKAGSRKSLHECERWRGEILRKISRKVFKSDEAP